MQQNLIRVLASLRRTLCPEYDNSMTLCFASETRVLLELHHSNLDRPKCWGNYGGKRAQTSGAGIHASRELHVQTPQSLVVAFTSLRCNVVLMSWRMFRRKNVIPL